MRASFTPVQPLTWRPLTASGPVCIAVCVVMTAVVATADYLTGYEVSLSVLYLAPVFVATWRFGTLGGVAAAVIATMTWYGIFANAHLYPHPFYYGWEALIRISTGIVFAILIDRLKIALARSDQRFVTVLEGLKAAVYVADLETGELLYMNEHGRAAFGGHDQSLQDLENRLSTKDTARTGMIEGYPQYEAQDRVTGNWYLIEIHTLWWVDGRRASLHVATDITARKRVEQLEREHRQQLEMSSRLIAAGEMASTLAHELNHPLAAVLNYNTGCMELLQSGHGTKAEVLDGLRQSTAQAQRAGTIVQEVRELIRRRKPHFARCDVRPVVQEAVRLLAHDAARNGTSIDIDVPETPVVAEVDRIMLQQLVLNLCTNAIEAMGGVAPDDRRLSIRLREDTHVRMDVADRGSGLPKELRRRLFIPFFSKKPDGMGLGLQICRSVAEYHDGRLSATKNSPRGTIFHFTFPVARQ